MSLLKRWWPQLVALALLLGTVGVLLQSSQTVGIPRDESVYFDAGKRHADWLDTLWREGLSAFGDEALVRHFQINREHPALPKILFGLSHRWLTEGLGVADHLTGFRVPAFFFAGLLVALTFLFGRRERSTFAGLFAALAMLVVPRQFFHYNLACFDAPATTTWLLTVFVYRWAQEAPRSWRRGVLAGLAFGLAIAVKHNAYFLPPLLVLHWLWDQGPAWWRSGGWQARWQGLPRSFFGFALIGPLFLYLSWPFLWHHPFERFGWYLGFHAHHEHYPWAYLGEVLREPPFPLLYPFVLTGLTVPLSLLLASGAGLAALLARRITPVVQRLRGAGAQQADEAEREAASRRRSSDLLLLLLALFPMVLIGLPSVPIFGGVKHWMHAMPFLFLLGGEAIETLVKGALPAGAPPLRRYLRLAFVAGAVLLPGALATAHFHPVGTQAYNEVAGGAPGAAGLGMQRHFWSHAVRGLLPWVNEHAPPGARIYFHEVRHESYRWYREAGLLRSDLRFAHDVAGSNLAIYQVHAEFRDREFEIWSEYGTTRPVAGLETAGVPLLVVYQRPGAERR
ncbi:MAG: glycosyltransferase family 39 protein [Deltaproteobacteria bacterium]|nr:glycosyltransferase family 39 protein [Deltaproteobacteria bacterium]